MSAGTSYSYQVAATNELGTGTKSAAVSAHTLPTPLSEGGGHNQKGGSVYRYDYYRFSARGDTYYIQWANEAHTGEVNSNYITVSTYWKSGNSMTGLNTNYFTDKTSGFAAPQPISAPDSSYIIVVVHQ